jgi:hypothetical protein
MHVSVHNQYILIETQHDAVFNQHGWGLPLRSPEYLLIHSHSSHPVILHLLTLSDEDINTSATIIPSIEILGPITRSRAQQLNHQVNSFLCSSAYNIESWLLPNDLIILTNQGEDHGGQTEHQEGAAKPKRCAWEGGEPIQFRIAEFESNLESRTNSYSNWCPDCIWPTFWTFYICKES